MYCCQFLLVRAVNIIDQRQFHSHNNSNLQNVQDSFKVFPKRKCEIGERQVFGGHLYFVCLLCTFCMQMRKQRATVFRNLLSLIYMCMKNVCIISWKSTLCIQLWKCYIWTRIQVYLHKYTIKCKCMICILLFVLIKLRMNSIS